MAIATAVTAGQTGSRIQNAKSPAVTLRAALVAATSYEASSHMDLTGSATFRIYVTLASVDYTSLTILPSYSYDGATWFEDGAGATTVTLANLQSATDGAFSLGFSVPAPAYARVLLKRTGGTAVGTVAIVANAGGNS